jgi:two-component system, OmpR family, sensor kinase
VNTPRKRSFGLAHKLYLLVTLSVVFTAFVLALIGYVMFGEPEMGEVDAETRAFRAALVPALLRPVAEASGDRAELRRLADETTEAVNVSLALYDDRGSLLFVSGGGRFEPLSAADFVRIDAGGVLELGSWSGGRFGMRLPGRDGAPGAYGLVEFRPVHRRPPPPGDRGGIPYLPPPLLWTLGVLLAVLAVVSFLFVRSLARPMTRLSEVARALGEGDLAARARLRRTDELGDLGRAFDEMADRLGATLRAQTELLANASHELRTPLARIRVALDLAHEGDAALAREQLGEIAQDLGELEALVSDILLMARLDLQRDEPTAPRQPLRLEPVTARALVDEAAARFAQANQGRELRVEVAGDLPSIVGDRVLLRRVVTNLLDNAVKYSDADRPISLRASAEPGMLRVDVEDEGIGIDAEDLERVFTPFFRTDRSRDRATGGVGLGLALARRVVEAHGGAINVESAPGRGSTFSFTIPAEA